jgi:hypothetical protein
MLKKHIKGLIFLLCLAMPLMGIASTPTGVNGDVRGVTFYYLDGAANPYSHPAVAGQGFGWVLDNQYDPAVRARIDNLLTAYRNAGVNWIRLLVGSDNFPSSKVEPVPSAALIKEFNDFLAITRSGANQGQFHIEVVLVPHRASGMIADVAPYNHDKLWLKTWIDKINYTNVGMVLLGGDLSPCLLSGCEGSANASAIAKNHGAWIKSIWAWKQANYPTLNASYEVIGVESGNNPALIAMLAHWNDVNTPTNAIMSAGVYISLPSGATWQQYAAVTVAVLDSYASASSKNLHIDEYGKSRGTDASGNTWSLNDQRAAYQGFLGAVVCLRKKNYAKFAWVAGRDYPYDTDSTGRARWNGLVDSFNGATPVMSATWSDLKLYYTLQVCP